MGNKGSTPQQMAEHRGQQISAGSWLSRLKQTQIRQQQTQTVSKADLQRVQLQLKSEIEKSRANRATAGQVAGRGARMLASGLRGINRSMTNVDAPKNRMAIAQLPNPNRSPMRQGFNLDGLKDPALRSRNLQGKRIK